MQYVIPFITLVLGVILGAGFGLYIKRPKLRTTGGGTGGGPGPPRSRTVHVQIHNYPGLFGLSLGETVVFGKHVFSRVEKGLTVDRNPAADCTAFLYDKASNEPITGLYWRSPTGEFINHVTIASGESVTLMLFARLEDEPGQYFAFAPESSTSSNPRMPSMKFDDTREFVVRVKYSYGRQELSFDATVRKRHDGLHFTAGLVGGSF